MSELTSGRRGSLCIENEIKVPEGATPKEALKRMVSLVEGSTCCDPATLTYFRRK